MAETLFKKVDYTLLKLMDQIELGSLGLPDIQRPFVWADTKVRDLFDSMYRGFPVGFFLFWENGFEEERRQIGTDQKQKTPSLLIVDGQQRLTSLYAVIKGVPVVRQNYEKELIKIAFNPLTEKFEVPDASTGKNPEFIPNITQMWAKDSDLFEIVDQYLARLRKSRGAAKKTVSEQEERQVKRALSELSKLVNYPFAALELSVGMDEEKVAEVFVRINSEGTVLNQADFILTLMSVFWEDGRREIEDFCKRARYPSKDGPSPYNHFIMPEPEDLLRAAIGFGFRRARLRYGYALLRGKDLETGEFSVQRREEQFALLRRSQSETLNIQHWHDFLKTIQMAGFRGGHMIASDITLVYAYVLYLIGKLQFHLDSFRLANVTARWFFMSALTRRYTGGSPETQMEQDLAGLRELKTAEQFIEWCNKTMASELTEDFWSTTLPSRLETSSANTPVLHAYHAALVLLGAKALFSKKKVQDLLDPAIKGARAAVERHHLFPKKHLATLGIRSVRDTNQIANYALVEWDDNAAILDSCPKDYAPDYEGRFSKAALERYHYWHALPSKWAELSYPVFLAERRRRIAIVIRDGFRALEQGEAKESEMAELRPPTVAELVAQGENEKLEFKSTLRMNLHTGSNDKRIEHACLKTLAAFLNSKGGTLIIGLGDDGEVVGVDSDGFPNEDKMGLHLVNLINSRLGAEHAGCISLRFEAIQKKSVMVVECEASPVPVYLQDGDDEQFFVRTGPATTQLKLREARAYIKKRFND